MSTGLATIKQSLSVCLLSENYLFLGQVVRRHSFQLDKPAVS